MISLGASYYDLFVVAQGIAVVALVLSVWLLLRKQEGAAAGASLG